MVTEELWVMDVPWCKAHVGLSKGNARQEAEQEEEEVA